jgi:hypothetical protein
MEPGCDLYCSMAWDLEGLSALVSAVGLDESVVDALGLEPGEQEVPELVRADGVGEAGGGVAAEHGPHPAGAVGLLPAGLEQVHLRLVIANRRSSP